MKQERVRLNVYLDPQLAEYLEKEVKRLGLSKSGYMNLLVSEKMEQRDVMTMANKFQDLLDDVEVLKAEKVGSVQTMNDWKEKLDSMK